MVWDNLRARYIHVFYHRFPDHLSLIGEHQKMVLAYSHSPPQKVTKRRFRWISKPCPLFLKTVKMKPSIGFNIGTREFELLRTKLARIRKHSLTNREPVATTGSTITLIDCVDSSLLKFRLTESTGRNRSDITELPIGSTLGLALLGTSPGHRIPISLSGERGQMIVLKISNQGLEQQEINRPSSAFDGIAGEQRAPTTLPLPEKKRFL